MPANFKTWFFSGLVTEANSLNLPFLIKAPILWQMRQSMGIVVSNYQTKLRVRKSANSLE